MSASRQAPAATAPPQQLAQQVAGLLIEVGVQEAYGIGGREIVPVWAALMEHPNLRVRHARHENGAGFAAIGSALQSGRPVAVFVTTGPGITNALTALEAARAAGAKLILLSPLTSAEESDRLGIQETGPTGYWNADLHRPGRLFDTVAVIESSNQLPALAGHLAAAIAGPGGHMAHVAIPTTRQVVPAAAAPRVPAVRRPAPAPSSETVDELVRLLAAEPFAVWVGWGARRHADAIRRLLDLTGAPVISSPRGCGIADRHPQFLGITGNGGHETLAGDLARWSPRRMLVLGTRLGEATSGWDPGLIPPAGLVHVDLDARVFARAYPEADTFGVQADVGEAVAALLARASCLVRHPAGPLPEHAARRHRAAAGTVHPEQLMAALQRVVVDATGIPVLADASSAMFWAARHLSFPEPGRLLLEGRWGSMGFAGAAVVGAASARCGPAVAVCGDASMHMQDEISTAVRYGIPAVWLVLNDSGLGIVRHGMRRNGRVLRDGDYPDADFAAVARAKGAEAARVTSEAELEPTLRRALAAAGPFLVDVVVDPAAEPPIGARANR